MKRAILTLLMASLAMTLMGGTDQGASNAEDVRSRIAESATRWASHPLGIPTSLCTAAGTPHECCTGNGAGVCNGVSDCTADGVPDACCTASGVGSCLPVTCGGGECCTLDATDQECLDFAVLVLSQTQRHSWLIELQTVDDAAFVCNPTVPHRQQNGRTPCRIFPATQTVVDSFVANACSFLASP